MKKINNYFSWWKCYDTLFGKKFIFIYNYKNTIKKAKTIEKTFDSLEEAKKWMLENGNGINTNNNEEFDLIFGDEVGTANHVYWTFYYKFKEKEDMKRRNQLNNIESEIDEEIDE